MSLKHVVKTLTLTGRAIGVTWFDVVFFTMFLLYGYTIWHHWSARRAASRSSCSWC